MSAVRTTCAYCGVGCGIIAEVTGERAVSIKGDPDHPANFGKLCSKGTHLGETVGLEGRLLAPMIGDRAAGWDEALDLVAERMRNCIAEHGPDSVAFYVSGQLLTEDYYVANKLMKGFVGSGNIDTNSRLCMASAVAAHNRAFGEDIVPCTYDDLDEADLILLVGSNTAWCHPVIWQRIEAARTAKATKIVVIDPRRTETAEQADLHVAVAPDGDVALFNALLAEMAARGLAEADVAACDPGVDAATFAALADLVAAHPRMVTLFSQGANQSRSGTDKGNAIINLHLATGRINAPGMGPFSITGQPNAMGGREVGGLANMLACHLGFSDDERADVSAFWQTERLCAGPGLKAVDMFQAVHDGRIKFLWVMATNPAVSMPDAGFVREALARCETLVVSDVIADTDTARLAHVRLPALAWGEKDGTVTNSERRISRQRALFPAPGEARADWAIIADVATRMGHGADFGWTSAAAVFREYAAMTALAPRHGKVLDLSDKADISDAEFEGMAPFLWGGRHPMAGRAAKHVPVEPQARAADPDFPLRLNTARYRDQWHTMTRTGLSPTLSQHRREPLLEVHPADAAQLGLADGGLARVETAAGAATFRVAFSEGQRRGDLCVPMHWTDAMSGEGRTNRLALAETDPVSGQPGFKDTPARALPVILNGAPSLPRAANRHYRRCFGGAARGWRAAGSMNWPVTKISIPPHCCPKANASKPRTWRAACAASSCAGRMARWRRRSISPARANCRRATGSLRSWAPTRRARSNCSPDARRRRCPIAARSSAFATASARARLKALSAPVRQSLDAVGAETRAGTNCGSCRPAIARLIEAALAQQLEAAE